MENYRLQNQLSYQQAVANHIATGAGGPGFNFRTG